MGNQQPSSVESKRCRSCKKLLSLDQFRDYDCRGKRLIKNSCKSCDAEWHRSYSATRPDRDEELAKQRERSRKWRESDPARAKARAKHFHAKYRERDRQIVYARYGGKCACCGESYVLFLTVDHVNSDGHIERKAGKYTNGSQFYRYIIQNDFPDDYQLLCFNCNLGRARNGGTCPHKEGSTIIPEGNRAKRPEVRRAPSGR